MTLLSADHIYTPEGFVSGKAVAFDRTIQAIDSIERLKERFPDAEVRSTEKNSVIYPGFINSHVHLEFSANKMTLAYGSFMPWLDSVISCRDDLLASCDDDLMYKESQEMLHSGVTTFGAISSFGAELKACARSPQRVVFFNELIGSNPAYVDTLYNDFVERLKASQNCEPQARIIPAIAIHAPYSVHPVVLKKAVQLAKEHHFPLSAHFLESEAEREWLESGTGEFKPFFEKYFNAAKPVTDIGTFLQAFDTYPTHFTHCVHANEHELHYLSQKGHSIAHCPRSNRYLGCGRLEIEALDLPFTVATDGLSSNNSLNLFDELRAALMMHYDLPLETLASMLLKAVTQDAAEILHLNCGKIETDRWADLAVVTLPQTPKNKEQIALWTILHTQRVSELYIEGERYV